jgi:hypothetical protein
VDIINKAKIGLKALFDKKSLIYQRLCCLNIKRSKRQERLHAISSVCDVMLTHLELASFRVGIDEGNGFIPLCDQEYIAQESGLSLIRVKRAFADLKKSGYLSVKRKFIRCIDGSKRALTAIKTFSERFFNDINVHSAVINKQREWKKEKLKQRQDKREDVKKMTDFTLTNALGNILNKISAKPVKNTGSDLSAELKKRIITEAYNIAGNDIQKYRIIYDQLIAHYQKLL